MTNPTPRAAPEPLTLTPGDLSVLYEGLLVVRHNNFNPHFTTTPAFAEVEAMFTVAGGGHRRALNTAHVVTMLHVMGYLHGLVCGGAAIFADVDGTNKTDDVAWQSHDLMRRLYGWIGADVGDLERQIQRAKQDGARTINAARRPTTAAHARA